MTVRELRAAWDAAVDERIGRQLIDLGYSRSGRSWVRRTEARGRVGEIGFERTCLKLGLRIKCYSSVWIQHVRQDGFGKAIGTLAGECPLWCQVVHQSDEIPAALIDAERHIFELALPEVEQLLESGRSDHPGVRISILDEL